MKTYITIVTILLTFFQSNAQTQLNDSEIAKTMQRLADTTIIVQYPSVWNNDAHLHLISKKGDTINAYSYERPKGRKINSKIPRAIGRTMLLEDLSDYTQEPVRINRYFTIEDTNPDTLRKLWSEILDLHLWKIKDDAIEGSGCPITSESNFSVIDGGGLYILLISRLAIKPLNFYAPDVYERHCPGREGRQTAIKLFNIVNKVFEEIEKAR